MSCDPYGQLHGSASHELRAEHGAVNRLAGKQLQRQPPTGCFGDLYTSERQQLSLLPCRHRHFAQLPCLVMTDLQAAVSAVVREEGSGLDPIPRGVYKALLSAREADFLLAKFAVCAQPNAQEAQSWAHIAGITSKRLRKFFDNQRGKVSKKQKASSSSSSSRSSAAREEPKPTHDAG